MSKSKIFVPALITFLLIGFSVSLQAQNMEPQKVDTITNEELKKAAAIIQEARVIQRSANQDVREIVKETENINFQRYRAIMIAKQSQQSDTLDVTSQENEALKKIQPKIAEINRQNQQKFNEVIKENGLTRQRLQQITLVIRSKPEVAKRFQKIMIEQQQQ